jgi:hypothetical protein
VPDAAAGEVAVLAPAAAGGDGTPTVPAEPARTLSPGGEPAAVAITFDGAYGFVAEPGAGRVAMFDPATRRTLATFDVGGAPSAIITGPYPPAVAGPLAFALDVLVAALIVLIAGWSIVSGVRASRGRRKIAA